MKAVITKIRGISELLRTLIYLGRALYIAIIAYKTTFTLNEGKQMHMKKVRFQHLKKCNKVVFMKLTLQARLRHTRVVG